MTNTDTTETNFALLSARELVLRFLALAASDPASERFSEIQDDGFQELACAAARYLAAEPAVHSAELAAGESSPESLDLLPLGIRARGEGTIEDHSRVFGLVVSKECPPYEVEYCPQTFSVYRSQRMADIAGFYRAFGLTPGRDMPERVDHLACELEFMAWLVAKERYALEQEGGEWDERARTCQDAQRGFFAEHVAWWVPAFAHALGQRAHATDPPSLFHVALAQALAAYIPIERNLLGIEPPAELVRPHPDEEQVGDCQASCGAGQTTPQNFGGTP
jgi:TorA maturation chaperone TorD